MPQTDTLTTCDLLPPGRRYGLALTALLPDQPTGIAGADAVVK